MVTLRCCFEHGIQIDDKPYVGHVKFYDSPGDSLQQQIASSLVPHRGLGPMKKKELNQSMGYLGTVRVYFAALNHRLFLDFIWPIHELLGEVIGHL